MLIRKREYKRFNELLEGKADSKEKENVTVGHALAPESDETRAPRTRTAGPADSDGDEPPFRIPPLTAIAGVLISSWAKGTDNIAKL